MKKYLLLAIIGMSFIPLQLDVKQIVDRLTSYSLTHPQEKIFVHFDKPHYSTGESIWMKAYLVDAFSNEPIALSNVVHLELFDLDMKVLDKRMLKIENGGVAAEFFLPDSLDPGTYHMRAYTNWMQNFNEAFFYRHSFKVLKTQVEETAQNPDRKILLDFFPEGGDLIDGISTIVAIKSTDQFGQGVKVEGWVEDINGSEIASIETDKRGMGAMILTGDVNSQYKAKIKWNGENVEYSFPKVKKAGYSLRVINNFEADKITIAVSSKENTLTNSGLIAHRNGEVFYSAVNKSSEEAFAVRIDRKDFPAGICHITFFDPEGKPQAERLVYANFQKSKNISLLKKESYETRSAVGLRVDVQDSLQRKVASNLSISITPQDLIHYPDNYENIVNYLMLTSDLIGKVEEPAAYLKDNRESFRSLDLLMLTQGWRRFSWEDVLSADAEAKPKYWVEDGITFSGQVVDYFRRDIPRVSKISLSVLNDNFGFIDGETDDQGDFYFTGSDFYDSTNLVFNAKRKLKREGKFRNDVFIKLHERKIPDVINNSFDYYPAIQSSSKEVYLIEKERIEKIERTYNFDKDAIMLDVVEVTGVNEKRNDPFESPFKIYGEPTGRVIADSIMRGVPMLSIYDLFRRLPSVRVFGSFPNQSLQIGGQSSINSGTDPLFLLDGVNVGVDVVNTITPSSVSHIDVLDRSDAAIYGAQGANGVIIIYTKSGLGLEEKVLKDLGILNHSHPGYSQVREFFSPSYEVPKDEHVKPDIRTTLYWNPTILVQGDSTSEVNFYTSDQIGVFDVIIQGIAVDGTPLFLKDSLVVE